MSKAQDFLILLESGDIQKIKDITKEFLDKFFPDLSMPEIQIKNNLNVNWLGQHVCFRTDRRGVIHIQKSIVDDDRTLKRVIAHELIHHWQCTHELEDSQFNRKHQRLQRKYGEDSAHGKSFEDWAAVINKVMGDNYVTKKSDEEYVKAASKEFFVMISPSRSFEGKLSYAYFQKLTPNMRGRLNQYIEYLHAKVFKTNNRRFLSGVVLGKRGTSVPQDQEAQDLLKDMYNSGTEVSI